MHIPSVRRLATPLGAIGGGIALATWAGSSSPWLAAASLVGCAVCGWGWGVFATNRTPTVPAADPLLLDWIQKFTHSGSWILDADGERMRLLPEHVRCAGLDPETAPQMSLSDYRTNHLHPEDRPLFESWLKSEPNRSRDQISEEICYRILGSDGTMRYVRAAWIPTEDGGKMVATQDVSDCKKLEERMLRGVLYDNLTGLPNRTLFDDRLASLLSKPGLDYVGIALMDLDRFLAVNASLGREAGDAMLLGLAVRLVGSLPPGTTVARVGEDEFAVLLEASDFGEGMRIAETMKQALGSPLNRKEREVSLTASVGLVMSHRGGCNAETLMQKAETALFQARKSGGDTIAMFDERQGNRDREEVSLSLELRQATHNNELELHFQPVLSLSDLSTVGFEALVRWRRPGVGLVPPGLFIPLAEANGSILEIGVWVLNEALAAQNRWNEQGWNVSMSVNLSPRQMEQEDIVDQLRDALDRHRVDPGMVKLEITESALAGQLKDVSARVARMRAMGVKVSLDDFGTGYSSLGHLHHFPVDTLKIDKSFVDLVLADADLSPVPRAVVALAHTLSMDVVAEGIETTHQLTRIREMGCEMGQGFLFSRPLPEKEALRWLREHGTGDQVVV